MCSMSAHLPPSTDEVGLEDLRRHVLIGFGAACFVAPLAIMLAFSRPTGTADWVSIAILALDFVGILTFLASRFSTAAGGAALTTGLILLGIGSTWITPVSWVVNLLPLTVLVASTFFEDWGGPVSGGVITASLLLLGVLGRPVESASLRIVLILTWANVLAAWLAAQPLRIALSWSWTEFRRAEREADRARRQQAELAQVVKSLTVAQDRLEETNRELERARRAADEARRLKAEFAATVSHELRTPLNLIIGFSEMLAAGVDGGHLHPDPALLQRDADTIYRNARHLSALIDDILDLAQIDAARMGLVREPVDLATLVRDAACTVQPLFVRKNLDLSLDLPETLPPITADRARIRQVLVNLLSNAARFTDAGGVQVSACVEDHQIVVSVRDTGSGIPAADLPLVFEEFRQVSGPLGRPLGHSGLGLTISKRLVEMHGGAMWVESEVGQGTTFFFSLPRQELVVSGTIRREWDTWARVPADRDVRGVLVVFDDEIESVRLIQRYFEGYDVAPATSLAEVRRLRQVRAVRAVVLTGPAEPRVWRWAQELREELRDLPVFLCPIPGRRRLAGELGVVDYLVKPVLREQVARCIRRVGHALHDVVVVDDDPDFVELLTRMIHAVSRRIQVRACYSGAEALAAFRTHRPDLVLLDLLMPGADGYAVLEAMRAEEELRAIPVVVVSARGRQEETITAGMLGISRGAGLTVSELMHLLCLDIEALTQVASSTDPKQPGDLPG